MNYVEWLRVRNALRVVAIVLGVMLVLGLGTRVWLAVEFGSDQGIIDHVTKEPGTVTTHTTYEGMPRTILVNAAEHVRVTIDDRADGGRTVTVTEPKSAHDDNDSDNTTIGSVHVTTTTGPATRTTVIDTNHAVDFGFLLGFACIVGLIVATIFGTSFARENNGHLEIAFLRPISRERLALEMMGADLACILLAELLTIIALIIGQSFFEIPHINFSGLSLLLVASAIVMPFSWYTFLNAASASLKRGAGAILGFSWPVAGVLILFANLDMHATTLGQAIHTIAWWLSRLVPLSYGAYYSSNHVDQFVYQHNLLAPSLLLVIYGALAIAQWRRVEA